MIDIRRLRMLAELDRLGTVAEVADALHLTAPAVSMQLSALEKEVGLTLTRRHGRRLALTPAGRVLAAHGHEIVDRLALVDAEVEALRSGTVGRYAVTAFPSAARTVLAQAVRGLIADEPALDLRLTTREPTAALDSLVHGAADVAIVHAYSNVPRDVPDGIVTAPLGSEPVWLAVRRGTGASARIADHADSPWVAPTADVTCYDMVERSCGLAGFRPRVVAESMDFSVQLELVAAGVGVALVPDLTVERVPEGVELLAPDLPVRRTLLSAVRAPSLADPGVGRILDALTEAATQVLAARRTTG